MNLEIQSPEHGAAYQVLFTRTNPQQCVTLERAAEIRTDFNAILAWAATQPPHVHGAYRWAAKFILHEIDRAMERNELGRQVMATLESIPKPPAAQATDG